MSTRQLCEIVSHRKPHAFAQDHIYTGWLTRTHRALVEKYLKGVQEGVVHAPWKDETWDRDHPEVSEDDEEDVNDAAGQDPLGFVAIGRRSKK